MVHGETTTRSPFEADDVIARLCIRGVEQLRGQSGIWVILDGSDLRKPYAQVMEGRSNPKTEEPPPQPVAPPMPQSTRGRLRLFFCMI